MVVRGSAHPPPGGVLAAALTNLPVPLQILTCDGDVVFESGAFREEVGEMASADTLALLERPNAGRQSAIRAAAMGTSRAVPLGAIGGRSITADYFPVVDAAGAITHITHVGVVYRGGPEQVPITSVPPPPLLSTAEDGAVERQLRFVIDMVPQMIWSTLADGYHDFYNRRWFEYIGGTPEETRGAGWNDLLHPDDQQRAWERWSHSLATGKDYEIEYRFRRHDGVYRWFLGRAHAMRDEKGRIVRWFGTCTDIDDQKRLDAERLAVLAQAEANNRMKDEFLATLSHELRTPLTSILGWAQIQRTQPELAPKAIAVIERNAQAQVQLIEEVLEVSRIVTGKLHLHTGRLDFATLVQSAVDTIRPAAATKAIELELAVDANVGAMIADAERLQQVAVNLLSNAVKFTPKGGRITVTAERDATDVVLTVRDTGCGITPSFLPLVFERFKQAEGGSTRKHGGLGLGLAIVRHMVELHGGSVSADSPGEGAGSVFRVRLPVGDVAREAEGASGGSREAPREPATAPRLNGVRVLIVEDDPDARALISFILSHAGAEIHEASSVDAALTCFSDARPHVVVSDIGMPGRDGYELITALRSLADRDGRSVPALALTAFARDVDAQRAMDAGFQLHVPKPVEPPALVAAVHQLATGARQA